MQRIAIATNAIPTTKNSVGINFSIGGYYSPKPGADLSPSPSGC